jgi:integrase
MQIHRLTAKQVERAKRNQKLHDGGGLIGERNDTGVYWVFRFMMRGKSYEMGLGTLGLVEARDLADEARRQKNLGHNPIAARNEQRKQAALAAARSMTFERCAELCIESLRAGWRSAKHAEQWPATLKTHVFPVAGSLPVQDIDVAIALKILEPAWRKIPWTMDRVRGRCETIIDFAKARDWYRGENPFRWRGHLEHLLPAPRDIAPKRHHQALPYADVGEFMRQLRACDRVGARALELIVMTGVRAGEALLATWGEFDLGKGLWNIAAERTKGRRLHVVPLPAQAIELLRRMAEHRKTNEAGELVFNGSRHGKPIDNVSLLLLARDFGGEGTTVHGFRSSFRSWAADHGWPREVAEAALGHAVSDATEAAYQRSTFLARRAKMMQSWCDFIDRPAEQQQGAEVVELHRA